MTTPEPAVWNRTIYRGTDQNWIVRRVDAGGTPVVPVAAYAQVRASFGGTLWLQCGTVIDPVDGWVTISIPEDATAPAVWDRRFAGIWDLETDEADGTRLRWLHGTVTVSQDVTREAP